MSAAVATTVSTSGVVEVFGRNQSFLVYVDGQLVAGAGRGGIGPTEWSWWSHSTQGRRVFVTTREEAVAQARCCREG